MTTTVTVKTHDWPVAVDLNGNYGSEGPLYRRMGHSYETRFQAANSEQDYTVTDTQSVRVSELPRDAVDLGSAFGGELANAAV